MPDGDRMPRAEATTALSMLWSASSIAVVGASDRAGALGRLPVDFLQRYGYAGRVLPVRPDGAAVAGLPSYTSLRDCPPPVDLAMIMVAAERVPAAVEDCVAAGVPVAIVCTSGFAETGADGAATQESIVRVARAGGLRLLGPNCIGTVGVGTAQVSSFSPLFAGEHTRLVPGSLGFVSQSGALGYGAVSLAFERGLGLGWIVNTGNEADVTTVEALAAIGRQPECRGLLGYVESLNDVSGLRDVVSTGVPVALLKAGRSEAGQRAAALHTGALAAEDKVVAAALRQLGIVSVDDVEDLLDVGDVMQVAHRLAGDRVAGDRVAIVTTSGGSGILAADAVAVHGLRLAQLSTSTQQVLDRIVPAFGATANPVDVTATVMSNSALFDQALEAIADDPEVDVVLACFCVLTGQDVDDVVSSLAKVAGHSHKPVIAVRTGAAHLAPDAARRMREAGIPCYPTPARAVRALAALRVFGSGALLHTSAVDEVKMDTIPIPSGGISESGLKDLLSDAGFPIPARRLASTGKEAREAVEEFGGRAVFKAIVPGLLHKSEHGGVVLGVTPEDAAAVWKQLDTLGGRVLVEQQVTGGVEALVGVAPSPLGSVLTVGVGGLLTELLNDVALRLLPVSRIDVEDMIDETRLGRLFDGVRGAGPVDRTAFVDVVLRLASMAAAWPTGFELDLNPIAVLPVGQGVRILDAAYVAPSSDDVPARPAAT
jgi:acetate---CoA ligase (ADP-forming)